LPRLSESSGGKKENNMDDIGIGLLTIAAVAYFIPCIIALMRSHRNAMAIFVLNLLLGWSVLGWIIALVWAMTAAKKYAVVATAPLATPLETETDWFSSQNLGRMVKLIVFAMFVVIILMTYQGVP
jgi:hypothetical protein